MKVFYSWQSDTPLLSKYLLKAIQKAVSGIDGAELYRADRHKTVDIDARILDSIDNSDYFISDVSIVGAYEHIDKDGYTDSRQTANPNVLYETGYAVKRFEKNRVLLMAAKETTKDTGSLPFDIRNRDILIRSFSDTNVNLLSAEIKAILLESNDPIEVEQPYILCENAGSTMSSDGVTMITYNFKSSENINYFLEYIELNGVKSRVNRDLPPNSTQTVISNGLEMSPYEIPIESISFVVSHGKSEYRIAQKINTSLRADGKYNNDGIIPKPYIVKV